MKLCFQLLRQMTVYKEILVLWSLHEGEQTRKRLTDSVVGGPFIPRKLQYYPCWNITAASEGGVHIYRYPVHVRTETGAGGHASPSPRRPRSNPRSVSVGFVVGKVELGQIFFPSTCVVPCQRYDRGYVILAVESVNTINLEEAVYCWRFPATIIVILTTRIP